MLSRMYIILLLPVFLLAFVLTALRLAWALLVDVRMANRIALSFDQLANAAFGGNPDETISSRAGRKKKDGEKWACLLCRFLDAFEKDHCDRSIGN